MIWTLYEILINIFEAWLILFYVNSKVSKDKATPFADGLCITLISVFFSSFLFWNMPRIDILVFIIPFAYLLFVSKNKWYISLFWIINLAVLFNSTAGICSHFAVSMCSPNLEILLVPGITRFMFLTLSNLTLFIIVFLASRIKYEEIQLAWPLLFTFFSISLCILITEECIYSLQESNLFFDNNIVYNIGYVSVLCCSLFSILLFNFQTESYAREQKYRAEASMSAMTQQHLQEFNQMYNDFSSQQHDFKHHLATIEHLISQNEMKEARNYLAQYQLELRENKYFLTGNISVDALLTAKFLTMRSKGISLQLSSYPLNDLPISTTDFCSIVGNLLDNAIEGIMRATDCSVGQSITLSFARSYQVFHISCLNYCDPKTIKHNKTEWFSSKETTSRHGLGIQSIQTIVNRSEGHSIFSVKGDIFCAEITIPYLDKHK